MSTRYTPQFVTSARVLAITALGALTFATSSGAQAALYRVSLMEKSKTLSTRTIDTEKPTQTGTIAHAGGGMTLEIQDKLASCDVFIEKSEVRVSLIENSKPSTSLPTAAKQVFSNSAFLTKQKIAPSEQTVYAGSAGTREVTVEAPKLNRTCTVSVL